MLEQCSFKFKLNDIDISGGTLNKRHILRKVTFILLCIYYTFFKVMSL